MQRILGVDRSKLWLLVVCLLSGPAWAANDPAVVPPAVVGEREVPYPTEAAGEASVMLEVLVEADGGVSEVTVVEGAPPFSEHARQAVFGWRFVPAQRGDVAVAARIRVRIEFHEPPKSPAAAGPAPSTAGEQPTPPPAADAPATAPVEITVSGERSEVSQERSEM